MGRSERAVRAGALVLATAMAAGVLGGCDGTYQPPTASGLTSVGRAQQHARDPSGAAASYRDALSLDPSDVAALLGLAELTSASVPVESAALLTQALGIAPRDIAAHRLLSQVLDSLGEKSAGRAQLLIARELQREQAQL